MIPVGYMYKNVEMTPEFLRENHVKDICSVSACISDNFADYLSSWKHNGYWLFDSPSFMEEIASSQGISLEGCTLFYYEAYEEEWDPAARRWRGFEREDSLPVAVLIPEKRKLEGYDIVSFSAGTSPECSPLSCNSLANRLQVNEHCLFGEFDDAMRSLERGDFVNCEPGPYRIFSVYRVGSYRPQSAAYEDVNR